MAISPKHLVWNPCVFSRDPDYVTSSGLGRIESTEWDSEREILYLSIDGPKGVKRMPFGKELYEAEDEFPDNILELCTVFGVSTMPPFTQFENTLVECHYQRDYLAAIRPA